MAQKKVTKIDFTLLARLVNVQGLTIADAARQYGVTRQRMSQICEALEKLEVIKLEETKSPFWYANRYGEPRLADRGWLLKMLKKYGGVPGLAAKLRINRSKVRAQAQRLNIDLRHLKLSAPVKTLHCAFCGKRIRRKAYQVRPDQKRFFCNNRGKCKGMWLGLHFNRGWQISGKDEDTVIRDWVEKLITEKGLSVAQVAKKFGVTREHMRKKCNDWNIATGKEKSPLWWANRYKKPKLADKAWLERKIQKCGSLRLAAQKIHINPDKLRSQTRRLGIHVEELRYHALVIRKPCAVCKKLVERKKYKVKPGQKHLICESVVCRGRWMVMCRLKMLKKAVKKATKVVAFLLQKQHNKERYYIYNFY